MGQHVCIIGGGVIGLATAYALVREGVEVSVIEARTTLASQTSFANGGQFSYRYVAPLADAGVPWQALGWMLRSDSPLKFRPRMDPAQWRWLASFVAACRGSVNQRNAAHLLRLALLSQATLQQWREEDHLNGFEWRRNGKLVAFREQSNFAKARQGVIHSPFQHALSANECSTLEPDLQGAGFIGGIYTPDEEVGDCHAFCQQLVARLQASGRCTFLLGKTVTRLHHEQGEVKAVHMGDEVLPVDQLVLAAGHNSPALSLPGLNLPLYPLKGYSLTLPLRDPQKTPTVSITDYDRKIVYARIGEQLRIAAMVDIVGFDPSPEPRRIAQMRQLAQRTFPDAGDYSQAIEWAGMRPATPSGVPILGASGYRNLWLNLGHGALGFTLACGSGRLLSELIGQRKTSIDLQGLSLKAA
ncbi:D-amino acid dehydrogenase [Pseudomonas psychrophila]|uniref:D-amino acid dehydrogenase n=1 Tax=Pseudomonas psychrophila TaxID=122355 RepID=UPI00031E11A1|nr:D-amino acid dehydrogenase [Pseudomonas psychrophila]